MKKIIWTALLTVTTSLAARLASRVLAEGWRRATHEDPPHAPVWAKLLTKTPLNWAVKQNVPAETV